MPDRVSSSSSPPRNAVPSSSALSNAERGRAFRRRRKDGLRQITVEIFEQELDALEREGLLDRRDRSDRIAVGNAVTTVLERAFAALAEGRLPGLLK
jgi:hypothetical protein